MLSAVHIDFIIIYLFCCCCYYWTALGHNKFTYYIQLFQEKLSEKVHVTIPKGIVGGFECTVLQRNLKEWHGRPRTYVCKCSRKAIKVGSTYSNNRLEQSIDHIPYITFCDCCVHIFADNLSWNSCNPSGQPRTTAIKFVERLVQSALLFTAWRTDKWTRFTTEVKPVLRQSPLKNGLQTT